MHPDPFRQDNNDADPPNPENDGESGEEGDGKEEDSASETIRDDDPNDYNELSAAASAVRASKPPAKSHGGASTAGSRAASTSLSAARRASLPQANPAGATRPRADQRSVKKVPKPFNLLSNHI